MSRRFWVRLIPMLAIVAAFGWWAGQAGAQQQPAGQSRVSEQSPQGGAWVRDPNSVMPMRSITNEQRKEAAARSAARRAAALRATVPPNTKGGTK